MQFYIPTQSADDWKPLLASPEKQWKPGYSAYALAHCWQAANGFPPEIAQLFRTTAHEPFEDIQPLLAIPEHKVPLPGRGLASQNDLFVLAKSGHKLISIMVEGKVDESFGPSVGQWKTNGEGFTENKQARFMGLCSAVGLTDVPDTIHYQLLHRLASAVIEAQRYTAAHAIMIVHSFSTKGSHWKAFVDFVDLFRQVPERGMLTSIGAIGGIQLWVGWASGNSLYLQG
ncbi:MAG TPA: hypothetical protein PLQ56_25210 [Aggregatilineales bacterium]|nr:hypothetical protein [Aggregatilineales bacterium]